MNNQISRVIESKLNFLKPTRTGKISLTIFQDKVLYHAINKMQRTHSDIPKNPFNTYYAYCLLESKRLNLEPNWTILGNFPNYNTKGDATELGEKFDMGVCHKIMDKPKDKRQYKKTFSKGETFNQGVEYWKYGTWYKYPDRALSEISNPCKEDQNWKPQLSQNDITRYGMCPADELRKAIRSGNINKKGLRFLRETYIKNNTEMVSIIDAYLEAGEEKNDNTQNERIELAHDHQVILF